LVITLLQIVMWDLSTQCYRIYRGDASTPGGPIDASNYLNLNVVPTNFPGLVIYMG
jgi:hypothetical protein